jgi:putative ABC transport system substrate-binding protein
MTKKIYFGLLVTVLLNLFSFVEAQQRARIFRIGYLLSGFRSGSTPLVEAFRQGMRDLGYTEGREFIIEVRWAEGDETRLPVLAADLVRLNVDTIVAAPTPPAIAAHQATKKIPIVVAHMSDPVESGVATNLARPGGNVTGLRSQQAELAGKRLELLKEAFPQISRVVVVGGFDNSGGWRQFREMEYAAQGLGLELRPLKLGMSDPDFNALSRMMIEMRGNGFTIISGLRILEYSKQLSELTNKNYLPAIFPNKTYAEAGGLMSYGIKQEHFHRRAAYYVDKILKGAKPSDLPVEQLTAVEFVVNLRTAKALNFTIPPQILMDADEVIR